MQAHRLLLLAAITRHPRHFRPLRITAGLAVACCAAAMSPPRCARPRRPFGKWMIFKADQRSPVHDGTDICLSEKCPVPG